MKNQRDVEFLSDGITIRGVLYLPSTGTLRSPYPVVVLGHGLAALKEWSIPNTMAALVQVGIAALSFDYRNFGDSGGEPREEVSHYGRLQDWHNAISYVRTLPEVDVHRVGVWGTSLGGRDVLAVASMDRRIKAVVAQTPLIKWTPTLAARMGGFGGDLERYQNELFEDRQKRTLDAEEVAYLPFVREGEDVKNAFVKSLSTAELRNYKGRVTLQSFQPTALIDVTPMVELIAPIPLLFILADGDFLPGQREAYDAAKHPKSLVMVKGHHFSPYMDSKEEATFATTAWFVKYLTSGSRE